MADFTSIQVDCLNCQWPIVSPFIYLRNGSSVNWFGHCEAWNLSSNWISQDSEVKKSIIEQSLVADNWPLWIIGQHTYDDVQTDRPKCQKTNKKTWQECSTFVWQVGMCFQLARGPSAYVVCVCHTRWLYRWQGISIPNVCDTLTVLIYTMTLEKLALTYRQTPRLIDKPVDR